jgi:hypothetical protein
LRRLSLALSDPADKRAREDPRAGTPIRPRRIFS